MIMRCVCYTYTDILRFIFFFFFLKAEAGIRFLTVSGVQTCPLPFWSPPSEPPRRDDEGALVGSEPSRPHGELVRAGRHVALGAKGLPVEGDLGARRQALQREPPGRTRRDLAAAHVERWGRGARGRAVRGGGRPGVTEQGLRDRVVDGGGAGEGRPRGGEQALPVGVQIGGTGRHDDDRDPA